jgi:hypothetical protein
MAWLDRLRKPALDAGVRSALALGAGERVLGFATDEGTGARVVASTHRLALVAPTGELLWKRPWHEAEAGVWRDESCLLTVSWVGRRQPDQWLLREASPLLLAVRDRIQASIVLADEFSVQGARRVRVAIRQDLASGALVEQVVPGRGVDTRDPEVDRQARETLARLRLEVGL